MGKKRLLNAPLKKGDTVQLISMSDRDKVSSGMFGTVTSVNNIQGTVLYGVEWRTPGGNKLRDLALIDGIDPETNKRLDQWFKIVDEDMGDSENMMENKFLTLTKGQILSESKKKTPEEFTRLSDLYDIAEIYKYLEALRLSGIINMFGASPYLYMGRDRIYHQHYYEDFGDEERESNYNYVLDNAEKIKNIMISGAYSSLGGDNIRSLERKIQKDATDLLMLFTKMKGGSKFMR